MSKLSKIVYKLCDMEEVTRMIKSARVANYFRTHKWPWFALCFGAAPVTMALLYVWHWPRKIAFPTQWVFLLLLIYSRFRMFPMRGIAITFTEDCFRKWNVLVASSDIRTAVLIYKIEKKDYEEVVCWCWPLTASRWMLVNIGKAILIRAAVIIRIIK